MNLVTHTASQSAKHILPQTVCNALSMLLICRHNSAAVAAAVLVCQCGLGTWPSTCTARHSMAQQKT